MTSFNSLESCLDHLYVTRLFIYTHRFSSVFLYFIKFGYICYDPDTTNNETGFNWVLLQDKPIPFDCGNVNEDAFKFTPMNFSNTVENLEEKLNVNLWYYSLPIIHVQCVRPTGNVTCRPVLGDQQYDPCADIEIMVRFWDNMFSKFRIYFFSNLKFSIPMRNVCQP